MYFTSILMKERDFSIYTQHRYKLHFFISVDERTYAYIS